MSTHFTQGYGHNLGQLALSTKVTTTTVGASPRFAKVRRPAPGTDQSPAAPTQRRRTSMRPLFTIASIVGIRPPSTPTSDRVVITIQTLRSNFAFGYLSLIVDEGSPTR